MKDIEEIKEKMREKNPLYRLKKLTNTTLSRGGKIERSFNMRNGKRFNKNIKGNKVLEKINDTINKVHNNISIKDGI